MTALPWTRERANLLLAFTLLVWFRLRAKLPWVLGVRGSLLRGTVLRPLPLFGRGSAAELQSVFARAQRWPVRQVSCLPRSLALAHFLALHGVAARVCLGVARRADRLAGHAWVEHDCAVIGDQSEFVATFARLWPVGLEGYSR